MQQTNQIKPTALILCFTHLHKDPRVLRQISWLKDKYQITTLGFSASNVEGVEHVNYDHGSASPILKKLNRVITFFSGDYDAFYWNANRQSYVEKLKNKRFDLIIANDYDTLPIGARLKELQNTTLLFDAHEYSPLEFTESFRWRTLQQPLIKHICREYISRATIATTVCQTIAETYEQEYGKKFEVITNATEFENLQPCVNNTGKIRMIYHGGASQSRQTHKQIEMMRFLDERFELSLMILGQPDYVESLKKMAEPFKNIKFLPPVGTNEIARFTNQFDLGIYSLPPTNFNNKYALPNKFFEFIQARLAVVIAPSPEMARIVKNFDLGVIAEDFSPQSMAAAIKTLTPEKIAHFKAQADKNAYELSAEKNRERLFNLIEGES